MTDDRYLALNARCHRELTTGELYRNIVNVTETIIFYTIVYITKTPTDDRYLAINTRFHGKLTTELSRDISTGTETIISRQTVYKHLAEKGVIPTTDGMLSPQQIAEENPILWIQEN
ncbi:hypothetical protein AVEN_118402-1 [Araneus ventricosus]|uniref:Transposase Tc1-like domain-containing protein n=1 Tax=Araneus ventricosus TaxID=182803 RepID=A0A4Y2B8U5_ARAVE|nr:hypothetical protein AVEN_118402-1 [Araneus ventricosus]